MVATPVIPALGRLRLEDHGSRPGLGKQFLRPHLKNNERQRKQVLEHLPTASARSWVQIPYCHLHLWCLGWTWFIPSQRRGHWGHSWHW
jgi:hypothetical protein